MAADPRIVSAQRSIAANRGWAMTPNRTERTAPGHQASPASLDYHIARIRAEGVVREEDIEAAAVNARRAYMQQIRAKGAAKKRAREQERQQQLRRSA